MFRRQTSDTLYGLSFREFLDIEGILNYNPVPLEDLLRFHVKMAMEIVGKVKVAPFFEKYLCYGYYPFYRENVDDFLMHALCPTVDKGNERETFFLSQLRVRHDACYPPKGDFLIDDKFLFEVGGKGKSFDQIAEVPDSYLAVDDTEVGHGNRIPLWLFGFLY